MNTFRTALLVCFGFFLGAASAAQPFHFPSPRKFPVGAVGAPVANPRIKAATVNGGASYTVTRITTCINADGSQTVGLAYTNAGGQLVSSKTVLIDSGCTKVVDNFGNVVSATGPSTECSAAVTFTGQVDTTVGNAATSGKLGL